MIIIPRVAASLRPKINFVMQQLARWRTRLIDEMPPNVAKLNYTRSSGPGGQNVNKLNTKAELRLDLHYAIQVGWLKSDVAQRLREAHSNRINSIGEFSITAQEYRTQHQNRQACFNKLSQILEDVRDPPKQRSLRTGISQRTKAARRDEKRKRSVVKQNRRKTVDW
uniref:Prokaryotic-type class I peptide chain release factors domain-containing protein n=1 Tax=Aureoumbra lagunensis TaxID=44058 RepID=A0A7S3NKE4_9STRA|mmetsp:Transcript_3984/g.5597  ORF Transcript_3984/g.5597 Transcript_3984/m.5597 type:complete len:167 (-) Transcript_3984:64-564(-)